MLKIKDNVDLKELEKYGFVDYNEELYLDEIGSRLVIGWAFGVLAIEKDTKRIKVIVNIKTQKKLNVYGDENIIDAYITENLYDLIKDGLVEKVED